MIPFLVRPVGRTLKPTEADSYPAESLSELRHWTDSRSYTVHTKGRARNSRESTHRPQTHSSLDATMPQKIPREIGRRDWGFVKHALRCYGRLHDAPWHTFVKAYIECMEFAIMFVMHHIIVYIESKDECCPELASGRPALLGAPH